MQEEIKECAEETPPLKLTRIQDSGKLRRREDSMRRVIGRGKVHVLGGPREKRRWKRGPGKQGRRRFFPAQSKKESPLLPGVGEFEQTKIGKSMKLPVKDHIWEQKQRISWRGRARKGTYCEGNTIN